jgi:hypothetical protein
VWNPPADNSSFGNWENLTPDPPNFNFFDTPKFYAFANNNTEIYVGGKFTMRSPLQTITNVAKYDANG